MKEIEPISTENSPEFNWYVEAQKKAEERILKDAAKFDDYFHEEYMKHIDKIISENPSSKTA